MGKRRFRVLDTNVLINHWRLLPLSQRTTAGAAKWARRLIEVYNTDFIASPVRIEFLCGVKSSEELKLVMAYVDQFQVVDEGQIHRQDWEEAERIAKRVGWRGRIGDGLEVVNVAVNRIFPAANLRGRNWRSEHCQSSCEGVGDSDIDKRNGAVNCRGSDWQRKQVSRAKRA